MTGSYRLRGVSLTMVGPGRRAIVSLRSWNASSCELLVIVVELPGYARGNYDNILDTWVVPGFLSSSPPTPARQCGCPARRHG
jgi:hypothetical protein